MKKRSIQKSNIFARIMQHVRNTKDRELAARHAYDLIVDKMIENVINILKSERVFKSDDDDNLKNIPKRPEIQIDVWKMINDSIDKHLQSLKYVMLGQAAGKDVVDIVESLRLKTKLPKGAIVQTYLEATDTHRGHFGDVTGNKASPIDDKWRLNALEVMRDRAGRYVDQTIEDLRNRTMASLQTSIEEYMSESHKHMKSRLLGQLKKEGLTTAEKRAIVKSSLSKMVERGTSLQQAKQAMKDATQSYETNWERIVRTEFAMASNVAAATTIHESAGKYETDPIVIILDKMDDRESEECESWSHHQDGDWKYYRLSSLKPAGYNLGKKKSMWLNSIPPRHINCYDDKTEVLTSRGFLLFKDVNIETDLFLSVDIFTGTAEWVKAIRKFALPAEKIVHYRGHRFDLAVSDGHRHVIRKHTYTGKRKTGWKGYEICNESIQHGITAEAQFLRTIPKWVGFDATNWFILGLLDCQLSDFIEFMGYWLSEGSISKNKNRYEIKITQHKPQKRQMFDCMKRVFHNFVFWEGENACYVPLKAHITDEQKIIDFFLQFGHAYDKYVPSEIKNSTKPYLELFMKSFISGDGSIVPAQFHENFGRSNEKSTITTSSPRLEADLCEIILKCGHTVGMYRKEPIPTKHRNGVYTAKYQQRCLRINTQVHQNVFSLKREVVDYNGIVYDVELEKHHTLIVKRDKGVVVSGNCRCVLIYVPSGFKVDSHGSLVALKDGEIISIES